MTPVKGRWYTISEDRPNPDVQVITSGFQLPASVLVRTVVLSTESVMGSPTNKRDHSTSPSVSVIEVADVMLVPKNDTWASIENRTNTPTQHANYRQET